MNILSLWYRDSVKMSTNVLDVDNGIDWLDIVENTAIMSAKIKHFLTVLFDRTAVHLEPGY